MARFTSTQLSSLALALLSGCPSPGGNHADSSDIVPDAVVDAPVDAPPPPMACRAGTTWSGTGAAFSNAGTADWGLTDARGVNLAVADLDGDSWADLVVFDTSSNSRSDFTMTPPVVHTRVYMNRPRMGGVGRTFVDATQSSNLLAIHDDTGYGRNVNMMVFADMDNDGDVDAISNVDVNTAATAPADPGDRSVVMLNDGHGVFSFANDSAITGSSGDVPQTLGMVFTDQNRDGAIDVFMVYSYDPSASIEIGQQPQLFRGHGDGTFDDVTATVGLTLSGSMSAFATDTQLRSFYGVTACDVNDDGMQDLIGAAYGRQWNMLFLNQGDHYTDIGRSSGVAGDMNTDYHTDQSYLCYCQTHATETTYCPPGTPAPLYTCPLRGWREGYNDQPWRLNGNTFAIACGDIDNDGDTDLYTAEIHHPDVGTSSDVSEMLVNHSTGTTVTFDRPGRAMMGLVPGSGPDLDEGGLNAGMWDWDDDGRLDVFLAASDYPGQFSWVFHQKPDGTFAEVGTVAGFHHACPHGIAVADFDHDGDQDVIVGSSTFRDCAMRWPHGNELRFYENNASQANWTSVSLVGRGMGGANRSAIGARVRVTAGGVTQTREVYPVWGQSAGAGIELPVHVGLGANCMIDRIEVRWPDSTGTIETFTNVLANYRVEIHQGEGGVRYLHDP